MAEKRYYWLKLTEQFFKDKTMKKLRKIAGGDTYTIIYLKMLLKAVSQGNKLYFEGVEENFVEELALDLDEEPENVSVTVSYLKSRGLLIMGQDEMELLQCEEMTGTETDAARRKRLQRDRERQKGLRGEARAALPKKPSDKASEEEKPSDKASGKASEEKPKKETQIQLFRRLSDGYVLSERLKEQLEVWFKYKTERKERYKEQGMKSLLRQIEKRSEKYGDEAVIDLIEECMGSNWKGIIWDKLEKTGSQKKSIQTRVSEVDNW